MSHQNQPNYGGGNPNDPRQQQQGQYRPFIQPTPKDVGDYYGPGPSQMQYSSPTGLPSMPAPQGYPQPTPSGFSPTGLPGMQQPMPQQPMGGGGFSPTGLASQPMPGAGYGSTPGGEPGYGQQPPLLQPQGYNQPPRLEHRDPYQEPRDPFSDPRDPYAQYHPQATPFWPIMSPYLKAQDFVSHFAKLYNFQLQQLNLKLGSGLGSENSIYRAVEFISHLLQGQRELYNPLFNDRSLQEYEHQIKDIVREKYLFTEDSICDIWCSMIRKSKRKLTYVVLMKELLKNFKGFNQLPQIHQAVLEVFESLTNAQYLSAFAGTIRELKADTTASEIKSKKVRDLQKVQSELSGILKELQSHQNSFQFSDEHFTTLNHHKAQMDNHIENLINQGDAAAKLGESAIPAICETDLKVQDIDDPLGISDRIITVPNRWVVLASHRANVVKAEQKIQDNKEFILEFEEQLDELLNQALDGSPEDVDGCEVEYLKEQIDSYNAENMTLATLIAKLKTQSQHFASAQMDSAEYERQSLRDIMTANKIDQMIGEVEEMMEF